MAAHTEAKMQHQQRSASGLGSDRDFPAGDPDVEIWRNLQVREPEELTHFGSAFVP